MASSCAQQVVFFPRADAAVLSCKFATPPAFPETVGPVFDPENVDTPVLPWSDATQADYPPLDKPYAPSPIPERQRRTSDRYLRAPLAENERFRLSMLWYYTRDIFKETEFIAGLQEKVGIAKETTGWHVAIVGILDVNFYTRLAAIGVPLGILPRGETLCAHTVVQPPGSVFLLPNMLEDWRFADSPYVESGGLRAYAGAPLRLQNETGDTACLGSLCVASSTSEQPLTKAQQTTLVRLGDWIVSDIVQLTRARRQRDRRRMVDLVTAMQFKNADTASEKSVISILRTVYPGSQIGLHSSKVECIEVEGRDPVAQSDLSTGLWEDTEYIDDFIANSNHRQLPTDRVVRIIAAQCESVSGHSTLIVGTKDFRLVFDDIDAWFVQTCADIISQMWQKHLLAEVMLAKEKFLRGFSHQLRTPLHGIMGSVELMAEELKSLGVENPVPQATALLQAAEARPAKTHGLYLDTIKRAGRDLMSIINSMITLNRWSDVAIRDRNYATHTTYELETELVSEVTKTMSDDARYNACVIFTHKLRPDYCSLRTDLGLLRDSLLPVIINAIQSTTEGIVAVTITPHPDLKELIVDVEDTGCGIPINDQERIFELYEQVDTHSTGAGLGLTLASKFAALLEGSVDLVKSEIGRGSHFRVTFQNVDLTYSEPPVADELANLPRKFRAVPSKSNSLTLCDQFAKFLTCHGLASTDDVEGALGVVDFVTDSDHHATTPPFSSDQVVVCLVPSEDWEAHHDDPYENIVYVHSPFITSTMSSALERADRLISQVVSRSGHHASAVEDVPVRPKLELPHSDDESDTSQRANSGVLTNTDVDSDSNTSQGTTDSQPHANADALEKALHSCDGRSNPVKDDILIDPTTPEMTEVPFHHVKGILPTSTPDTYMPSAIETAQVALVEIHSQDSTSALFNRARTSHPTTLIVDDNAVNLRVMQMYCEKRGLPYVCAEDGLEAVSVFEKHQVLAATQKSSPPIQLVLMDFQMPRCNGIEATKRIRQLEQDKGWGKSVLFIVTGQDSRADREAAADADVQEYLVKPVGLKMLDAELKRYFPEFDANKKSR